jgi:hypothetical protein
LRSIPSWGVPIIVLSRLPSLTGPCLYMWLVLGWFTWWDRVLFIYLFIYCNYRSWLLSIFCLTCFKTYLQIELSWLLFLQSCLLLDKYHVSFFTTSFCWMVQLRYMFRAMTMRLWDSSMLSKLSSLRRVHIQNRFHEGPWMAR